MIIPWRLDMLVIITHGGIIVPESPFMNANTQSITVADLDRVYGQRTRCSVALVTISDGDARAERVFRQKIFLGRFRAISNQGQLTGRFRLVLNPFIEIRGSSTIMEPETIGENNFLDFARGNSSQVVTNGQAFVVLSPEATATSDELTIVTFTTIENKSGRIILSTRRPDILASQELLGEFRD